MRWRQRMVQQTLVDHVTAELDTLEWMGPDRLFGLSEDLSIIEVQPDEVTEIPANVLALYIEDQDRDTERQMGGGLYSIDYSLLADMRCEQASITVSLAEDVKQVLHRLAMRVRDYSEETPVETNEVVEVEVEAVERPSQTVRASELRRTWRVLTAIATVTYAVED